MFRAATRGRHGLAASGGTLAEADEGRECLARVLGFCLAYCPSEFGLFRLLLPRFLFYQRAHSEIIRRVLEITDIEFLDVLQLLFRFRARFPFDIVADMRN